MTGGDCRGGCWPTGEQEWLLQAALLQGQPAEDAWERWKSTVDVDDLDDGSQRLLPMLYRNLRRHGIQDPLLTRFRRAYRKTWVDNRLLFHRIADVLRALHQAGIATLVLKGAALIPRYYHDYSLRPMKDFDLLIRPADLPLAVKRLREIGLTNSKTENVPIHVIALVRHALFFEGNGSADLDLHWWALRRGSRGDDAFWAGAAPTQIEGVPTLTLNPTDELLHTCAHGVEWNPVPPIRWAVDAMVVLNTSAPEIDWIRLAAQARERRLTLPVTAAFEYLSHTLHAPVPPEFLASLKARPASRFERMEYEALISPDSGIAGLSSQFFFSYVRCARGASLWQKFAYFPSYLQFMCDARHLWQLPERALAMRRRSRSSA